MSTSRFPEDRATYGEREIYSFGPYRLDVDARRLTTDSGRPVPVTPRGFDLLAALVRSADRAVPRSQLLEEVWQDVIVEEGNLDTHVSALRRALAELPGAIETVRGYGYRFAVPVERTGPPAPRERPEPIEASRPVPRAEPAAEAAAPEVVLPAPPAGPRGRGWAAGLAVAGLIAAFVAWRAPRSEPAAPPPGGRPTVAVFPLENLSGRPEDAWLATALREVLSTELAFDEQVAPLSGESVMRIVGRSAAGAAIPASALARARDELGADLVVVGSYLAPGRGDALRVDLQLEDARRGRRLLAWTESGTLEGLLPMLARAGAELRRHLPARPAPAVAAATPGAAWSASPEALRLYTEGLVQLREFRPLEARELFEQATAEAPEFARAHAALAVALGELGYEQRARESARRAHELARLLPREERLRIEALERETAGDAAAAAGIRRRLASLFPDTVDHGLELARSLSLAGEHEAAAAELRRLAALPPPKGDDPRIELQRGWTARYAGDFAAMREAGIRAAAEGRRRGAPLLEAEGLVLSAWAELTLGRVEEGLVSCSRAYELSESRAHGRFAAFGRSLCGWLRFAQGDVAGAEAEFESALAIARRTGSLFHQSDSLDGLTSVALGRGAFADAARFSEQARAIAREGGSIENEVDALRALAAAARMRGELERAESLAGEGLELARAIHLASRESYMLTELGLARLDRGDAAGAVAALEEARAKLPGAGPARIAGREIDLAWAQLASGDLDAASRLVETLRSRLAGEQPGSLERIETAALASVIAARGGRLAPTAAERELLAQAVDWELNPFTAARARLARAESLDREGRSADAAALLRAGVSRPAWGELELGRLESELRAVEIETRSGAVAGRGPIERLRARARELRFGRVLGETL